MNFDEYDKPIDVEYPDTKKKRKELLDAIDSQPMTKVERDKAYDSVNATVNEWFKEAVKPYNKAKRAIEDKFWADCREDLGYDKLLNEKGIAAVEAAAWDRGHSSGYSEVYHALCDYVQLVEIVLTNHL